MWTKKDGEEEWVSGGLGGSNKRLGREEADRVTVAVA